MRSLQGGNIFARDFSGGREFLGGEISGRSFPGAGRKRLVYSAGSSCNHKHASGEVKTCPTFYKKQLYNKL